MEIINDLINVIGASIVGVVLFVLIFTGLLDIDDETHADVFKVICVFLCGIILYLI